jgi:hypothetical protein
MGALTVGGNAKSEHGRSRQTPRRHLVRLDARTGPTDPSKYRLHSSVVLIEFEHLPGVAFDNPEPSRLHNHTVIRTDECLPEVARVLDTLLHEQGLDGDHQRRPG